MSEMSPEITEELVGLVAGRCVLDIGCGDASLLKQLSGRGLTLCGIDPAFQDGSFPPVPDDVLLLPGTAEEIPFPDRRFDTVILQCVFSLCRPQETAGEVYRVLKPGGRLLLADLYTEVEELAAAESLLLGKLWQREHLEHFFSRFRFVSFSDATAALTEMLVGAIWSGEETCLGSCSDLALLRRAKVRYGLWVWEKPPDSPL